VFCCQKYKLEDTAEGEQLATKVAWFMVDIGQYDTAGELLDSIIDKLKAKYGEEAVELADPLHATMQLLMNKGTFFKIFFNLLCVCV
jgi:hypothetical protein